jgi:hypothetical protein
MHNIAVPIRPALRATAAVDPKWHEYFAYQCTIPGTCGHQSKQKPLSQTISPDSGPAEPYWSIFPISARHQMAETV